MDELFELSDDKLEEARKEDEAKILDLEGNDLVSESDDGEPPLDIKLFLPNMAIVFFILIFPSSLLILRSLLTSLVE